MRTLMSLILMAGMWVEMIVVNWLRILMIIGMNMRGIMRMAVSRKWTVLIS